MLLAPPPAATAPASPAARYGFRKADLGMDLPSWRASAPSRASAACAQAPSGVVVCHTADQPLGERFRARELTHTFANGRLARISYTTSVDGFADAVAELEHDFGPPGGIKRDTTRLENGLDLPHVLMSWRNGRSTIRLSDPAANGGRLRVTFQLDAMAEPARAG